MNINLLSPDNRERALVEVMFSSSFDQRITVPTRVTEDTATLFDHIWSHSNDGIVFGGFDASISDHHITFAFLPFLILTKKVIINSEIFQTNALMS